MKLIQQVMEENPTFPNLRFIAQYYCPIFFGYENMEDCKSEESQCVKCWIREVDTVKKFREGRMKFQ